MLTHLSLPLHWDIFEPRIASILSFIPSKFVKRVLSVRTYGRVWGYRNELDTVPGLEGDLNTVRDKKGTRHSAVLISPLTDLRYPSYYSYFTFEKPEPGRKYNLPNNTGLASDLKSLSR